MNNYCVSLYLYFNCTLRFPAQHIPFAAVGVFQKSDVFVCLVLYTLASALDPTCDVIDSETLSDPGLSSLTNKGMPGNRSNCLSS